MFYCLQIKLDGKTYLLYNDGFVAGETNDEVEQEMVKLFPVLIGSDGFRIVEYASLAAVVDDVGGVPFQVATMTNGLGFSVDLVEVKHG